MFLYWLALLLKVGTSKTALEKLSTYAKYYTEIPSCIQDLFFHRVICNTSHKRGQNQMWLFQNE